MTIKNLNDWVKENQPEDLSISLDDIEKWAKECGFSVERIRHMTAGKRFLGCSFLWYTEVPVENGQETLHIQSRDTRRTVEPVQGENVILTYAHNEKILMDEVVYCLGTPGRGNIGLLPKVYEQGGIATEVRVATPEPVVEYPEDPRDGAPKKGTRMFLSRAKELGKGHPQVENVLGEPTGEVLWQWDESCWINACWGHSEDGLASKEEAEASLLKGEIGACGCGETTASEISSYVIMYGEKKY